MKLIKKQASVPPEKSRITTLGYVTIVVILLMIIIPILFRSYNPMGTYVDEGILWDQSMILDGGYQRNDQAYAMVWDPVTNQLIVGGSITTANEGRNGWIGIFTTNLTLVTQTTFNGIGNGHDEIRAITHRSTGDLYVIGDTENTNGDLDVWIAHYDSNLTLQNQTRIDGPGHQDDWGYDILPLHNNNLLVIGTMSHTYHNTDIWIAQLSPNLSIIDERLLDSGIYGPDEGRAAIATYGNIYVTGAMSRSGAEPTVWVGLFNYDFDLLDEEYPLDNYDNSSIGHTIVRDENNTIYVGGGYRGKDSMFLAQYSTPLLYQRGLRIMSWSASDEPYNTLYDLGVHPQGYVYFVGTVTLGESDGNAYLEPLGLGSGYGTEYYSVGTGIAYASVTDAMGKFYLAGSLSNTTHGSNIWLASGDMIYEATYI